jgi:hypothetical protein
LNKSQKKREEAAKLQVENLNYSVSKVAAADRELEAASLDECRESTSFNLHKPPKFLI